MKKGISLAIICRAGAYGWAIRFTLALIANSFNATGQVQFHVPGGSSAIVNNTANGNLAIGMSPSPNATLSIDANGLKPLDIFTADATYRFATHAFTLMSRPGFSHAPILNGE